LTREEGWMFTRRKDIAVPEVGADAPEFNLPSAQGGQLRLGMRTAHGPVVVVFFRGAWSEEDVEYFKALSEKEDEINHARASVVGIGIVEPDEARELVRASSIKSYVLYDYVRVTTRQWGLLEKDKEHGEYARPAVFIVDSDRKVVHAWADGRPPAEEILAKVSEITGLPKPAEEAEEKPEENGAEDGEKPKKMSAEERERIKAERRAAREAGKSVKTGQQEQAAPSEEGEKPKKMSAEERERIKAERRAAREAGKSLKQPAPERKEVPEEAQEDENKPESRAESEPEAEEAEPKEATGDEAESGERAAEAQAESEPEKFREKDGEEE
jgi:peroxiredoxin